MNPADIKKIAHDLLASDESSHGWDHAERVWNLCRHIGRAEGADLEILRPAAYLHDIGRPEEKASGGEVCHATAGAARAGTGAAAGRSPGRRTPAAGGGTGR